MRDGQGDHNSRLRVPGACGARTARGDTVRSDTVRLTTRRLPAAAHGNVSAAALAMTSAPLAAQAQPGP